MPRSKHVILIIFVVAKLLFLKIIIFKNKPAATKATTATVQGSATNDDNDDADDANDDDVDDVDDDEINGHTCYKRHLSEHFGAR